MTEKEKKQKELVKKILALLDNLTKDETDEIIGKCTLEISRKSIFKVRLVQS